MRSTSYPRSTRRVKGIPVGQAAICGAPPRGGCFGNLAKHPRGTSHHLRSTPTGRLFRRHCEASPWDESPMTPPTPHPAAAPRDTHSPGSPAEPPYLSDRLSLEPRSSLKIETSGIRRLGDRLAWIPDELESSLRASFTEQQLAVPTGIPIRLTYELGAPLRERPLCQPVIVRYTSFSCLVVSHGT